MAKKMKWQHIRQLVDNGATLEINGGGYHLNIASLYEGEQLVCMFRCDYMDFDAIMGPPGEAGKAIPRRGHCHRRGERGELPAQRIKGVDRQSEHREAQERILMQGN